MTEQALVSIIIPTYNRAHLIAETLDSILSQTYENWECIVVDDGSIDDTEILLNVYIAKDNRFQYYKRPNSHLPGGNGARNYGFELSKGDYINWFDDDDIMLNNFISSKIRLFENKINLVICSGFYVDNTLSNLKPINLEITSYIYKDYVLWHFKIVTNNVLFRRKYLANKMLFNQQIVRGQEAEFFSRLFFNLPKEQYCLLNESLFLYRQHERTKTTLNKSYNPSFKSSEIYLGIENLKRSVLLKDNEMIHYFYRLLINFFFRAIENRDDKNSKKAMQALLKTIKPLNWWLFVQLTIIGNILRFQKRVFYKLEMYFKTYNI